MDLTAFRPVAGASVHMRRGQTIPPFAVVDRESRRQGEGDVIPHARERAGSASFRNKPELNSAWRNAVSARDSAATSGGSSGPRVGTPARSSRRRGYLLFAGIAGVIALLLIATVVTIRSNRGLAAVNPDFPGSIGIIAGDIIPEFTAAMVQGAVDPYGTVFSSYDLFGKVSVVIVWASWDAVSVEWLDQLQLMQLTQFNDLPVNWIGVNYHDNREDAMEVIDQTQSGHWPHLRLPREPASDSEALRRLGISWVPAVYVFDEADRLRYVGWSPSEMEEILGELVTPGKG